MGFIGGGCFTKFMTCSLWKATAYFVLLFFREGDSEGSVTWLLLKSILAWGDNLYEKKDPCSYSYCWCNRVSWSLRSIRACTYDTELCIKMLPLSFVTVWTFGVRSYSCDISGKCTFGSGLEGSFCVNGYMSYGAWRLTLSGAGVPINSFFIKGEIALWFCWCCCWLNCRRLTLCLLIRSCILID